MPRTVILGAARTPVGKLGGGLSSLHPTDLGGLAIKAALERAEVAPDQVQHVVMGHVLQAGAGQIPSRQAQIKAGIPKDVSSETINKVCASGIRAAGIIDAAVRAGDLDLAVGGGMESMSQAPYLLPKARFGFRMGDVKALDTVVEIDESPRRDTSLERLAALPGLTGKDGSHTAGNSPGVNDGAGAIVLASDEWAERNGKEALATIVAQAAVADDFEWLARTPANAAIKALEKAGLQPGDIDLWEINEAFASVTLNSVRMLGIDEDRVNVNGGAVAIGHPIGASGARILATLVHELRRRGGGYGCAAICSGGGQGDAVIVQV